MTAQGNVAEIRSEVVLHTRIENIVGIRAIVVLLPGAADDRVIRIDMYLPAWMLEIEELGRNSRNGVVFVRNMCQRGAEL